MKVLPLLVMAIIGVNTTLWSQNLIWNKGFGGTSTTIIEKATCFAENSKGELLIAGVFEGSNVDFDPGTNHNLNVDQLTSSGDRDIFILKVDAHGVFQWVLGLGGTDDDYISGIEVDQNDNFVITGKFRETVDFDPYNTHSNNSDTKAANGLRDYDIFIAKYDANGNMAWVNAMGDTEDDGGTDIAIGANGDVYACGYFAKTVDFDPRNLTISGSAPLTSTPTAVKNAFVVKYDLNGKPLWLKHKYTGTSNEYYLSALALDNDEDVYVAGTSDPNVVVEKLGKGNGNLIGSTLSISMTSTAEALGLDVDANENVYITGHFGGSSAVDFDPSSGVANLTAAGGQDIFIAKYTNTFGYSWAHKIGSTTNDEGHSLKVKSDGRIFVTGSFTGSNVDFNPGGTATNLSASGGEDIFMMALTNAGVTEWARALGSSFNDGGTTIGLTTNEQLMLLGQYSGTVDFDLGTGTSNATSNGGKDAFVAQYSPCGFSIADPTDQFISIGLSFVFSTTNIAGYTYQWQLDAGSGAFSNIFGATTSSYVGPFATTSMDHNRYRVKVTNSSGCSYYSNPALLKIDCGFNEILKAHSSDKPIDIVDNYDNFGVSVAIDGDYAVIGACEENHDANGANRKPASGNTPGGPGAAYVYQKNSSGNWVFMQKLVASDRRTDDFYGVDVDISGTNIIIGAFRQDLDESGANAVTDAGAVYFYSLSGGVWGNEQKVVDASRASDLHFGKSVSISGDYAVIGAPGTGYQTLAIPPNVDTYGFVMIYRKSGGTWVWDNQIDCHTPSTSAYHFGASVSISGYTILVGTPDKGSGEVCVFERSATNTSWYSVQTLTGTNNSSGAQFGTSVDVNGNWAIVGANKDSDNGSGGTGPTEAGSATIYERSGGAWVLRKKVFANVRGTKDYFGRSVAITNRYAVVGANGESEDENNSNTIQATGAVYVFHNNGTNSFPQYQKLDASDRAIGDELGKAVAIDNETILGGAPSKNHTAKSDAGGAYFYDGCAGIVQPVVLPTTVPPSSNCSFTLNINGSLGDATHWAIYTGGCGRDLYTTTTSSSFTVNPAEPSYFIRGEGGDVTHDECLEISVYPSMSHPIIEEVCETAIPFKLPEGSISGGIYTGVGTQWNGSEFEFDPAQAGVGNHLIKYHYAHPNGCSDELDVEINVADANLGTNNGNPFPLLGKGITASGSFGVAKLVQDPLSSDFYAVGSFEGDIRLGHFDLTSSGFSDIFVVRFNECGVTWAKSLGGVGIDEATDIEVITANHIIISANSDNNITLAGNTHSIIQPTGILCILSCSDGTENWGYHLSSSDASRINDIAVTNLGSQSHDFAIAGEATPNLTFNNLVTDVNSGYQGTSAFVGFFTAATEDNGHLYAANNRAVANKLAVKQVGSNNYELYATGEISGTGIGISSPPFGTSTGLSIVKQNDLLLLKYSTVPGFSSYPFPEPSYAGIYGADDVSPTDIKTDDHDTRIFTVGKFTGDFQFPTQISVNGQSSSSIASINGTTDGFQLQLDDNGTGFSPLFINSFGTDGTDVVNAIEYHITDDYTLVGTMSGSNVEYAGNSYGASTDAKDGFLYSTRQGPMPVFELNSSDGDNTYDDILIYDSSTPINHQADYLVGTYNHIIQLQNSYLPYDAFGSDLFIARRDLSGSYFKRDLGENTGTQYLNHIEDGVSVYPNPFSDELIFDKKTDGALTVQLFDVAGRQVFTKVYSGESKQKFVVGVEDLPAGLYYLSMKANGKELDKVKLIKK